MKWMGTLIAAWMDIRAQPMRAVAIVLGLSTAISAIVLADASNRISEDANAVYVEETFGREATFIIRPTDYASTLPDYWRQKASAEFEAAAVREGIPQISRYSQVDLQIPGDLAGISLNARWVSPSYVDVASLDFREGSWPIHSADASAIHVVVTQAGLIKLGLTETNAVGTVVYYLGDDGSQFDQRLRPRYPMVIEGVVESSGRTQEGVELLIVTNDDEIPGLHTYPTNWLVHAAPEDQSMIEHLAQSFLGGTDPAVMFDVRRLDQQGEIKPVLDQQKTTSYILSLIILGVAAIGLVSTGLSNIRERAQEFGIRRAIGVTTKSVFAGVVMQTLMEAIMAAGVALAFSAIVVATMGERLILVDVTLTSSPILPLASALKGTTAALAVGLIASLLPAFRAAHYSVAEVIRA